MKRQFKVAGNPFDDLVTFNKGDSFHLSTAIVPHFFLVNSPLFVFSENKQLSIQQEQAPGDISKPRSM